MHMFQVGNRALPRCAAGVAAARIRSSALLPVSPSPLQIPTASGVKKGISPMFCRRGGRCQWLIRYECREQRLARGPLEIHQF